MVLLELMWTSWLSWCNLPRSCLSYPRLEQSVRLELLVMHVGKLLILPILSHWINWPTGKSISYQNNT